MVYVIENPEEVEAHLRQLSKLMDDVYSKDITKETINFAPFFSHIQDILSLLPDEVQTILREEYAAEMEETLENYTAFEDYLLDSVCDVLRTWWSVEGTTNRFIVLVHALDDFKKTLMFAERACPNWDFDSSGWAR